MKNMGLVEGNKEQAKPLVIGKSIVYVHTDIKPAERDGTVVKDLFTYNEVQYEKDEFIELIVQKNEQLDDDLTDTQLALCEIYETIGGSE